MNNLVVFNVTGEFLEGDFLPGGENRITFGVDKYLTNGKVYLDAIREMLFDSIPAVTLRSQVYIVLKQEAPQIAAALLITRVLSRLQIEPKYWISVSDIKGIYVDTFDYLADSISWNEEWQKQHGKYN